MSEQKPSVSIVVTAYNAAGHIRDGLLSVLGQSFVDYEVIVVDDHSTDDTTKVVEDTLQNACRFRVIRLGTNCGGPAEPRNVGVSAAQGKWICLLDSDDVWHPRKLEIELNLARETGCPFVSSEKRWFKHISETEVRSREELPLIGHSYRKVTIRQLRRKNFLCTSSVLCLKDIFAKHRFNPDASYRAVEDYLCWLHIHEHSVEWSPQILTPLVFYRIWGQSISKSKYKMVLKHWNLYRNYFRGRPFGWMQVSLSMGTYGVASIYRQFKYRQTRC